MAINDYLQGINNAVSGEKADVNTATEQLSTYQAGAGSLTSKLKEALNTKLNNNKDIIDQQSETMQNYFNSGANARVKYADVWDPVKRAALVQQDRSMALRPYDTLSGVLENRMGSVADIVTAGTEGWKGLVDSATTKLDSAKSMLSTALQAYMSAVGQQNTEDSLNLDIAKAKESSRQFGISSDQDQQKIDNQVKQFGQEMALKLKELGAKGGTPEEKTATALLMAEKAATDSNGNINPDVLWSYINANMDIMKDQGVNVQKLWDAQSRLKGPAPAADPNAGKSWMDQLLENSNNPYGINSNPTLSPYVTKT